MSADADQSPDELDLPPALLTPTLAGIYLQQGHTAKALAIYRRLLAQKPGDPERRRLVATLEQRLEGERARGATLARVDELKRMLRRIERRRRDG